jgi:hypothetical protein
MVWQRDLGRLRHLHNITEGGRFLAHAVRPPRGPRPPHLPFNFFSPVDDEQMADAATAEFKEEDGYPWALAGLGLSGG